MPTEDWRPRPPRGRAAIARIVQVAGLFDVVTAVLPPGHRAAEFAGYLPMAGVVPARAATVVVGALLVHLGSGLRRGKRRAWQIATALTGASVVLHATKSLGAAAVSAALCVLLVAVRAQFRALPDRGSRGRALRAAAGLLVTGFLLGFGEIAVRWDHLAGTPGVSRWAAHAALGLLGITGPVRFAHPGAADLVSITTGVFGLLALATALFVLLRPATGQGRRAAGDEARLRELLEAYGGNDSLGYFALRADKLLSWAPNGRAAIAYRVVNGVSLAAGDPVGIESAWPDAIEQWLTDATRHGWTPAVLGCSAAGGRAFQKRGLDLIELGDEAVLDVATFSLDGRPMRTVRQAVNRIRRAGYTCRVARLRDLPPDVVREAVHAADALRDGPVERGFSMALSRLGDPRDGDCVLVLAHDGDGRLRGLLQFVPWGGNGLSLDLMRGDRSAGNGLTELMVTAAVEAAPALGVDRISLNFAVLRSVFARAEQLGAGPVLRLWHRLLTMASRVWQIESLYRANAKYLPHWQPRYLCFPTARDLPRIAVAALVAEAFLPLGGKSLGRYDGEVPAPADGAGHSGA